MEPSWEREVSGAAMLFSTGRARGEARMIRGSIAVVRMENFILIYDLGRRRRSGLFVGKFE